MGRNNIMTKRAKRRSQKAAKKTKKKNVTDKTVIPDPIIINDDPLINDGSIINDDPIVNGDPIIHDDKSTSWGSPSPPPSVDDNEFNDSPGLLTEQETQLYGVDNTLFCYDEDERNDFELDDGTKLEGEKLIQHLIKTNRNLSDKARLYQKRYEDSECEIGEKEFEAQKKIKRIRHFYRNMILFSNSRSALMVKKAMPV